MAKRLDRTSRKSEITDRLLSDYDFRTVVFSVCSLFAGIGLALFNMAVFSMTDSLWCGAMAFYHILLVILRGHVLLAYRRDKRNQKADEDRVLSEMKRYRACGIVFIVLTLCLVAMITLIVRADKVFNYQLYMIYIIAGFTLFQMIVAIANYIKVQSHNSYTVRALRCINLTSALASFISLQAIALDTFSHHVNIPFANALTGFIVCGLITASGLYMIIHATIRIKALPADKPSAPPRQQTDPGNITNIHQRLP